MLATADGTARELGNNADCTVNARFTPLADRSATTDIGAAFTAARCSAGVLDTTPIRTAIDRHTDHAGSIRRSTVLPRRTSRPRLDADEWDDRTADDDDTDVPVKAWLRDMVRGTNLVPAGRRSFADWIRSPSIYPRSHQRLRC
jgi:hypothetical protein